MTSTHEVGHLVGGWLSGASLISADLRPWGLPYSLHQPDPHPLVTLWAGPLVGVLLPILAGIVARNRWVWFVADFCLLANGLYLAAGWWAGDRFLDTPRLLEAGASSGSIALFCVLTIGIGYVRFRTDCVEQL